MTIRSVCCVCNKVYATKPDGRDDVRYSHGYCEKHYDEAMVRLNSQFAEYPADRAHAGAVNDAA